MADLPTDPGYVAPPNTGDPTAWWNGPPPAGWTGPWPPALPGPGYSYGSEIGSVVYTGGNANTNPDYPVVGTPNGQDPNPVPGPNLNDPNDPLLQKIPGVTPSGTKTPGLPTSTTNPGTPTTPYTRGTPTTPDVGATPTPTPPPPIPDAPGFNAPPVPRAPAFQYGDFTPPTGTDVWNDPSYQFRFGEGFRGLENSKAAQGVIGTGGSIKDFINYGQNFASNEYNNAYNRSLQTYATNRSNALDTYNTNYGTQYRDPFLEAFQNSQATLAPQLVGYQTGVQNQQFNQNLGFNRDVLNYNQQRNAQLDSFDEWYRKFLLQLQATQL